MARQLNAAQTLRRYRVVELKRAVNGAGQVRLSGDSEFFHVRRANLADGRELHGPKVPYGGGGLTCRLDERATTDSVFLKNVEGPQDSVGLGRIHSRVGQHISASSCSSGSRAMALIGDGSEETRC